VSQTRYLELANTAHYIAFEEFEMHLIGIKEICMISH